MNSNSNPKQAKNAFDYDDLLSCAHGELFGQGNARLPLPPMLMFNRVTMLSPEGGAHGAGEMTAEFEIKPDLWFFKCHFEEDPVMPGCLGLDALWQMLGFYLGWLGLPGPGRALSVGGVKFFGEVKPTGKVLRYRLDIKRVVKRAFTLGIADGYAELDGERVYEADSLRAGLFPQGADKS